jgi:hypothetical protein
LITAGSSKRIAAWFDASGLEARVYRGKVDIECLDCRKERGCTQDYDELTVEMKVIKSPRPAGPAKDARPPTPTPSMACFDVDLISESEAIKKIVPASQEFRLERVEVSLSPVKYQMLFEHARLLPSLSHIDGKAIKPLMARGL